MEKVNYCHLGKITAVCIENTNYDDKVEIMLDNYEVIEENGKYYAVKKKPKYPSSYEECCKILGVCVDDCFSSGYKCPLLSNFQELLICRDAYWKIAGEDMGWGKPWKPDWLNVEQDKYVLFTHNNAICSNRYLLGHNILAFPTVEMRGAFYENFKDLIEEVKELL